MAIAGAVRLASSLLALADDAGLGHLQARCLDFIVHNFRAVVSTSATSLLALTLLTNRFVLS